MGGNTSLIKGLFFNGTPLFYGHPFHKSHLLLGVLNEGVEIILQTSKTNMQIVYYCV